MARDVGDDAPPKRPRTAVLLTRGLTKRCANCGGSGLFVGYFKMAERCPTCGMRLFRHEGQMSGDIGINTIVTFGLLFIVILVGALATRGTSAFLPFVIVGAAIVIVFPVVFVPFSRSLWLAMDVAMNPPVADDFP